MSESFEDATTRRILEAALVLFARHGFQRTSMADVAKEAQVARATLYSRFHEKPALYETLAHMLVHDALSAAAAALKTELHFAARLEAAILAKDLKLYRMLHASPHGAELLAVDAALTRMHVERLDAGFAVLLARFARAMGADLAAFGNAQGFGRLVGAASAGLKHEIRTEADYRAAVRAFSRVIAKAAARPPH